MTTSITKPAHLRIRSIVERTNDNATARYKAARLKARRRFADHLGIRRVDDGFPGMIVYRGPSQITGEPVAVVLTGLSGSKNGKTGEALQLFIIPDGEHPRDAIKRDGSRSTCGDCPHQLQVQPDGTLKGACYASQGSAGQALNSVAATHARGRYPEVSPKDAARIVAGCFVRFGAWGDPAAAPIETYRAILGTVAAHTGYTHQIDTLGLRASDWSFLQASADSEAQAKDLQSRGWRTFRVGSADQTEGEKGEIHCPSDSRGVTCIACGICDGTTASAWLPAHGAGAALVTG